MSTMPRSDRRRRAPILVQGVDLFLIELTNWRWSWRSMVLTATLAPVASILALSADTSAASFICILNMSFLCLQRLCPATP